MMWIFPNINTRFIILISTIANLCPEAALYLFIVILLCPIGFSRLELKERPLLHVSKESLGCRKTNFNETKTHGFTLARTRRLYS